MKKQKSVLVWGPFGFIGRHLTDELVLRGMRVTAVSRPGHADRNPVWHADVHHVELEHEECSTARLRDIIAECDVIYDLAGASGAVVSNREPVANLNGNCRIQLWLLEACAAAGNRPHVVFSSSRLVYGDTGHQPVSEDHPVRPQSVYAAHKLCIEHYLQIYARLGSITYTICRISNVYGSDVGHTGQGYRVVNAFIRAGLAGQTITLFGDGKQLRDFIYIKDLVEALIRAGGMQTARNQLFNIGSGTSSSMYEAASLIRTLTGAPPLRLAPWPRDYELVESGDYVADISKARTLLALHPAYDLKAGLNESIALLRQSECIPRPIAAARQMAAQVGETVI
jgi:nucleoside-diphosphate-sugar epimerase